MRVKQPSTRRGAALFIVMLFVVAVGVMALTAIVTTGNASLVSKSYARENDLRYSAEAALAIGKSRINTDATALPDTGYKVLLTDAQLMSADNQLIPGVKVTVFAGPSGSTTGQFGRFASIVAEARDNQGNGFIRRLELSQESFAKYAYWSDKETSSGGGTIYFGNGDQLWGPVWSNDVVSIAASGATFNDDVATAKTISGSSNGTFRKGYKQNQKPIALPSTSQLSSKLLGFATPAGFNFNAPTSTNETGVRMRIEFVAIDMNNDGDSLDVDEGFFKVYQGNAGQTGWVRGDWPNSNPAPAELTMCGDWHAVQGYADQKFFPASIHATQWFRQLVEAGGLNNAAAKAESSATVATIMQHAGARCYLGGDPHLVAVERPNTFPLARRQIGGDDTTFSANGNFGAWRVFSATPGAAIVAKRGWDAPNLFPIHRSLNALSKGVIYVDGTTGVSGVLRGKITLYATGTIVVLDDSRYANDPGKGVCQDILGLLAANDVVVADNALLTPQRVKTSNPTVTKNVDDTKDLYLHSVIMALNTSFRVQDYDSGPDDINDCEGADNGRGCLYLSGGLIQKNRGAVGLLGGEGYVKRYSYDRCAIINPPPYFPTTGRFADNRYYELNPVGFNATTLYKSITPDP